MISFYYKGEQVILELEDNQLLWVYAYNMRMKLDVVPSDLKVEIIWRLGLNN